MKPIDPILTQTLDSAGAASEQLLPLVYRELRTLAAGKVARDAAGRRHDATSLVHQAYLRLRGDSNGTDAGGRAAGRRWDNQGHFFAAAAEAMRRILVDQARRQRRPKHGGGRHRVDLDEARVESPVPQDELLALNEALAQLEAQEPDKAQVVKLRYFAGLSIDECAAALGISPATAKRRWTYARAWLYSTLTDSPGSTDPPEPKNAH